MDGDDRTRFCRQCNKNVFNLSAMTSAGIEELIREKEGRFCGRFYQRPDGRMLTADCPVGTQRRRSRLARLGGTIFAAVMFFLGGRSLLRSQENSKAGNPSTPAGVSTNNPRMLLGDVAIAPPKTGEVSCSPALVGRIAMPSTNTPPPVPPKNQK